MGSDSQTAVFSTYGAVSFVTVRGTLVSLSIIEIITADTILPRRHARHSCLGGFR